MIYKARVSTKSNFGRTREVTKEIARGRIMERRIEQSCLRVQKHNDKVFDA